MDVPKPDGNVRLAVQHHGRAPAKHGRNAYKFAEQAARLLKARGWKEVGRGSKYVYFAKSSGNSSQLPFQVNISIPSQEQILAIALQLHEAGQKWLGRIGEWDAGFRPANNDEFSWTSQEVDFFTATAISSPVRHTSKYNIDAIFVIGTKDAWSATVTWKDGRAEYAEHAENVIPSQPDLFSTLHTQVDTTYERVTHDRYEGALERTTTNRYERSWTARCACIAHYGPVCSICGFDFGVAYGAIALGFIHVHHIVPLHSIGEKYEVDPVNDLVPVCPNCHVVVHMSDPPLTVAEVKTILERQYHETKQ